MQRQIRFSAEVGDALGLIVFKNIEVFSLQVCDELPLAVSNTKLQVYTIDVDCDDFIAAERDALERPGGRFDHEARDDGQKYRAHFSQDLLNWYQLRAASHADSKQLCGRNRPRR